jgi:hypothetical protein
MMTLTRGIEVDEGHNTLRPRGQSEQLQVRPVSADISRMLRYLGIPALLVTVFIGLYLSTQDMKSEGTTSQAGQQAIAQAHAVTAGSDFSQAVPALQAFYDQYHTYAGATLPAGSGVTLVSADTTSYCLQSGNVHEDGPGGQPEAGPC